MADRLQRAEPRVAGDGGRVAPRTGGVANWRGAVRGAELVRARGVSAVEIRGRLAGGAPPLPTPGWHAVLPLVRGMGGP